MMMTLCQDARQPHLLQHVAGVVAGRSVRTKCDVNASGEELGNLCRSPRSICCSAADNTQRSAVRWSGWRDWRSAVSPDCLDWNVVDQEGAVGDDVAGVSDRADRCVRVEHCEVLREKRRNMGW